MAVARVFFLVAMSLASVSNAELVPDSDVNMTGNVTEATTTTTTAMTGQSTTGQVTTGQLTTSQSTTAQITTGQSTTGQSTTGASDTSTSRSGGGGGGKGGDEGTQPTPPPDVVVTGGFEVDIPQTEATAFVSDPQVQDGFATGIADTLRVDKQYVAVTLTVRTLRRLQASSNNVQIDVSFVVTVPGDAPPSARNAATGAATTLAASGAATTLTQNVNTAMVANNVQTTVAIDTIRPVDVSLVDAPTTTPTEESAASQSRLTLGALAALAAALLL